MSIVAICQIDLELGRLESNLDKARDYIVSAAEERAGLIVFPELTLTGYQFQDDSEIENLAMNQDDDRLNDLNNFCFQHGTMAIIGFIEQEKGCYYNTVAIFGQGPDILRYRKIHLAPLGIDRYMNRGNLGFPVFDTCLGKIGMNICYDQLFPESARSLAVQGAQIIVVPTSEIMAQQEIADIVCRTRAYENRVFYLWANRIGNEQDSIYTGSSRIIDPLGQIVALAGAHEEEIIYCEIEPAVADDKRSFESIEFSDQPHDIFFDRSPQDYHWLV